MTDTSHLTKAELLANIDHAWNDFHGYLANLNPTQVTIPTDAAGWTALDHVIHLAQWENSMIALMNKQDRATAMGIDPAVYASGDYDIINGLLQQQTKDLTLPEAFSFVMGTHQRFIDKINTLSEEDLHRSYQYFQPQSDRTESLIDLIYGNTVEHYPEHQSYIAIIVADRTSIGKAELLSRLQKGWDDLNTFLASLTDEQKTKPTDAAGWTVKDHMIHMAAWEDGLVAMFNKQDRRTAMDIDQATWESGDDPINAVIHQRYKDLTLTEVEAKRQAVHTALLQQLDSFSEQTIQGAYSDLNPNSDSKRPIADNVIGNTYMHYADHMPWMAAIANRSTLPTKTELVARVQKGWDELNSFLDSLSDEQKTKPTDAAGWTVKDHMIHLAAWEIGLIAMFNNQDRRMAMDIDQATWDSDDDPINAVIQQRYKDLSLAEVEAKRRDIHAQVMKHIDSVTEETLNGPYSAMNPSSDSTRPIAKQVMGDTYLHFADHIPWMAAIANTKP